MQPRSGRLGIKFPPIRFLIITLLISAYSLFARGPMFLTDTGQRQHSMATSLYLRCLYFSGNPVLNSTRKKIKRLMFIIRE